MYSEAMPTIKSDDSSVATESAANEGNTVEADGNDDVMEEYDSFQQRAEDIIASKDAQNLRSLEAMEKRAAKFAAEVDVGYRFFLFILHVLQETIPSKMPLKIQLQALFENLGLVASFPIKQIFDITPRGLGVPR